MSLRIRALNDSAPNPAGLYVLYWMTSSRRTSWNFALDRALHWCAELGRPLVVFEALRADHPWASERLHAFVLQGMADNARALASQRATYFPYVEPEIGAGKGLLAALARRACVVVTDEFPCFFLPRMQRAAASRVAILCEAVDSNGLYPLRATDLVFPSAYAFRRHLQQQLEPFLDDAPASEPFAQTQLPRPVALPESILKRWPAASAKLLALDPNAMATLAIDHTLRAGPIQGGRKAGLETLSRFLDLRLARYLEDRGEPQSDGSSGCSAYLHFGQLCVHEILHAIAARERWTPKKLAKSAAGKKEGWWNLAPSTEAFLDELVTWRELGYQFAAKRDDYERFESLPVWAQATLSKHAADRREHVYTLAELARAATHDPLWNAAQQQLVGEGRIHNYLRMLWGKKILQWTSSPRAALAVMIELNNRYALDGRDPNSYSGIFWVLGRFDRPWGPERPIFGSVRYMTSENTARKLDVKGYIARWTPRATSAM